VFIGQAAVPLEIPFAVSISAWYKIWSHAHFRGVMLAFFVSVAVLARVVKCTSSPCKKIDSTFDMLPVDDALPFTS
jgi:hypothetical protein